MLSEIAAVVGPEYATALRSEFLDPLGLEDTFLEDAEPIADGFVDGSLLVDGMLQPPTNDVLWPSADGTLVTNAADLLDWFEHLFVLGDVLPAPMIAAMTTPTVLEGGGDPDYPLFLGDSAYGFGIAIESAPDGPIYWHGGLNWGFLANISIQPSTQRGVAVLLNTENVDRAAFAELGWELLER